MWIDPITLEGNYVRLEPMSEAHLAGLQAAAAHPEIWDWTWPGEDPETVAEWMQASFKARDAGSDQPFTTIDKATGEIVGSTRFMGITAEHKRLEIGNTWLCPSAQRSPINTEAKLLMMTHAFEEKDTVRLEFKTHHRNEKSRNAILRLGAVQEGILRRHMIFRGDYRDSVYFSVLQDEWPNVKQGLQAKLDR